MKADVLRCGFLLSDAEAIGIYELCMRHFKAGSPPPLGLISRPEVVAT